MTKAMLPAQVCIFALAMLVGGLWRPAAAGEEVTIRAFSAWEGHGQAIQTGPNDATFVGTIAGAVYVDTDKGPVEAGHMVCPAIVEINLNDGSQTGTARCTITGRDGAQVFAELSCTGIHLVGCDGDSTLTGGTDRFAGVTGGGRFTLRSGLRELVSLSGSSVQETVTGIIFWRELHYKIP